MKLQNLTVIFIIIIIPIILIVSLYISTGLKTIKYQSLYDTGLLTAAHDAIYAFEQNTANDKFAGNPERKRDILKSSIKMFEKSLCNTCGISSYNTEEIEEYIPAIVFGMYDGFYMYAPSGLYNSNKSRIDEYSHNLKNYVYYSEVLEGIGNNRTDVVIRYSLDNYVVVLGDFGGGYEIREGYLINLSGINIEGDKVTYRGVEITSEQINGRENIDAINYYKEAFEFTDWFLNNAGIGNRVNYLKINSNNDPEDESSPFNQHKKIVIKQKIESVLNSSITAYSERTHHNYKMPKFSEEDWEKIYSNISMITFFQGKSIGLTKYNGYCVLNSTNSNEYVNPNLMYFIDSEGYYHDVRCSNKKEGELNGYKIGDFRIRKVSETNEYIYNHNELACYHCVNGSIDTNESIYKYIDTAASKIKTAYWTSLARERYNTTKLIKVEKEKEYTITYLVDGLEYAKFIGKQNESVDVPSNPTKLGHTFDGWDKTTPTEITNEDITINAKWKANEYKITFKDSTTIYKEETLKYGDIINLPTNHERYGYYFIDWEGLPSDGIMPAQDLEITATWGEAVATIGNKGYRTLSLAVEDMNSERTVKLIKDTEETINIQGRKGTIDLNGKTVTGNIYNNSTNITIKNGTLKGMIENKAGANINIQESSIETSSSYSVYNEYAGTITIIKGRIENTNTRYPAIWNNGTGTVTITNNTIITSSDYSIYNKNSGKVIISGKDTLIETVNYCIYNGKDGKIEILGGTIKNNSSYATIYNFGEMKISGEGTRIFNSSPYGNAISNRDYGKMEILDGTIENDSSIADTIYTYPNTKLTIRGGIIRNNHIKGHEINRKSNSERTAEVNGAEGLRIR